MKKPRAGRAGYSLFQGLEKSQLVQYLTIKTTSLYEDMKYYLKRVNSEGPVQVDIPSQFVARRDQGISIMPRYITPRCSYITENLPVTSLRLNRFLCNNKGSSADSNVVYQFLSL